LGRLSEVGVKDSKLLTPKRRNRLYHEILDVVERYSVEAVQPAEVDKFVLKGAKLKKLNYLEALYMGRILDELNPDYAIIDSCDIKPRRFAINVLKACHQRIKVAAYHHADREYTIVAAASIIAKVHRDREIESLKKRYGDFGSGYPSDPLTREFLRRWVSQEKTIPPFSRRSWKTWNDLLTERLI